MSNQSLREYPQDNAIFLAAPEAKLIGQFIDVSHSTDRDNPTG